MDLSGLPTDPSKLAARIAAHDLPVDDDFQGNLVQDLGGNQLSNGWPYSVFEGAAVLLIGPTSGMTPALASALFQVMAAQPGVELLGTVTDHDGRRGQGIAMPAATSTQVREVIVDPATGQLLEARFVPVPSTLPSHDTCGGMANVTTTTCVPVTGPSMGTAPLWVDVVASGVVGSPTATVPGAGRLLPTATLAPAAPTGVVGTAVPVGDVGTAVPANGSDPTGTVHLSWTAPADPGASPVVDYIVYQTSPGNGFSLHDTGSAATSFTWPWPKSGATYTVQAINGDAYGPASAPSAPVPALVPGPAPGPPIPSG